MVPAEAMYRAESGKRQKELRLIPNALAALSTGSICFCWLAQIKRLAVTLVIGTPKKRMDQVQKLLFEKIAFKGFL